jgi:hypothetical protein
MRYEIPYSGDSVTQPGDVRRYEMRGGVLTLVEVISPDFSKPCPLVPAQSCGVPIDQRDIGTPVAYTLAPCANPACRKTFVKAKVELCPTCQAAYKRQLLRERAKRNREAAKRKKLEAIFGQRQAKGAL